MFVINLLKYALVVPILIKLAERFFNFCLSKLLLNIMGCNKMGTAYHSEDACFDFIRAKKGELEVEDKIARSGDIIISN
jgi:hypothetical protein